jgi:hypothetical protein
VTRLRVGRIAALNMYPIYHGLERAADPSLEFTDGVPTTLNQAVLEGRLDVSAMSSIAYARNADRLTLVPVASITAEGAADSIQVFSRVPFEEVRTVAVTPHSATSVALLRILLGPEAPAFAVLDRPPPVIADRLSITLLPREALEVARDLGLRPQDLLADPADALRRWYERQTPPDLDHALNQGRGSIVTAYEVIRESSKTLDASLPQMVDSALEKSLFQLDRLREGVFKKLKHRRELASPRYRHLPDFLAPRRRPQEREIGALALPLLLGGAAREAVSVAARLHVDGMAEGQRSHFLGNF